MVVNPNVLTYEYMEGQDKPHELVLKFGNNQFYIYDSFQLKFLINELTLVGDVEEREDVSYTAFMFDVKADAMLVKMLYDPDSYNKLTPVSSAAW